MFTQNIDPVLLRLGPIEIRYYGLAFVISFLLLYYFFRKNRKEWSMTEDDIDIFLIYFFIGLIIGSRIFNFLIDEPEVILKNPLEFFMIWHGGMSFFGGFIGALVGSYLFYKYIKKIPFLKIADVSVIVSIFSLSIGRIANFINSELVGHITSVNWCINFPGYEGCRHPYQIYASFSHFILFIILFFVWKKFKSNDGITLYSFMIGYGLFRFFTDFFRDDPIYFGLTAWQYFCIIMSIVGLIFLTIKLSKKKIKRKKA